MNKISAKQEIELAKRRLLKWELYQDQKGICPVCGRYMNYRVRTADNYPELSHKKPLSQGGKTERGNVEVICAEHHANDNHGLRQIYNEQPDWYREVDI